ncbi:MAG: S41 family peptidase [bacterium]
MKKFVAAKTDKLVLDLRGNPGGYLDAAVDISSWFLPTGKAIVTEDTARAGKRRPIAPRVMISSVTI